MATKIQLRRGSAAEWTAANPVLADGEVGVERDTRKQKVGDGATAWNALPYATASDADASNKGTVQLAGDLGGTAAAPVLSLSIYTSGTRPAADATTVRRLVVVKDPGAAGELHFCRQAADGSYEWIVVAF